MSEISRRRFLKYALLAAAGATVAGAAGYGSLPRPGPGRTTTQTITSTYTPPSDATQEYAQFLKWIAPVSKPYSGRTLNVSMEYEFSPLALQRRDLDLFNATGINNQYDLKPYYLHLADITLMTKTQAPTYDLISVDYQDVASFKDYIISPTELADRYPDLTYEKLNPSDFQDLAWANCASYPPSNVQSGPQTGDTLFIPLDMATMIQFYRKDQFDGAGLTPAKNWDDYLANAMALVNTSRVLGTVNEANPDISIVFEYLNFLKGFGADLWLVRGGEISSGLGSDAALQALEAYIKLRNYSDPASLTYSWPDIANSLLHGYGAEALQFQGYSAWMDDRVRSTVVGEIDYAPIPAGPAGSFSTYGGSGIGVSKFSKHPDLAWLWLQWATALGTQEVALLDYFQPFPSRKAVFDNSVVREALGSAKYRAVQVTKKVWESGELVTFLPFPRWTTVLNPISFHLNKAWTGAETPRDALAAALKQISSYGVLSF